MLHINLSVTLHTSGLNKQTKMEVVRIDQEIRVIFYWRRKNQKDTYKPRINYEERNNRLKLKIRWNNTNP